MTDMMKRAAGTIVALLLTGAAADAAGILQAKNGMTLYVFDKEGGREENEGLVDGQAQGRRGTMGL